MDNKKDIQVDLLIGLAYLGFGIMTNNIISSILSMVWVVMAYIDWQKIKKGQKKAHTSDFKMDSKQQKNLTMLKDLAKIYQKTYNINTVDNFVIYKIINGNSNGNRSNSNSKSAGGFVNKANLKAHTITIKSAELNKAINAAIDLSQKYNLLIIPNSQIQKESSYLKQVFASKILVKNPTDDSMKLAEQTIAVINHLADEWQVIISRAEKQAGIIQDAQDSKNLLNGNIEDLSDKAKTKYLLNLGNEIKTTTDKKAR